MKTRFRYFVLALALCIGAPVHVHPATLSGADRLRAISRIVQSTPALPAAGRLLDGKCGTRLMQFVREHWNTFSPDQQSQLQTLLAKPAFEKVRVIGHFEINYDTTDINEPAMLDANGDRIAHSYEEYVDSVGKYFNYAWEIEVDSLGYLPPPIQPGHSGYVVTIQEYYLEAYGYTYTLDQIGTALPIRSYSYISIDNDYLGFYSQGIAGLRVTSAHEFHHAIQFGRYGQWPNSEYFHEMTSTWMETVVQPSIRDYFQYLFPPGGAPPGQFQAPETSFTVANGLVEYSRAIWGKYIEKRFSRAMMRRTWENIGSYPVLQSINRALIDSGSTFQQALLEWNLWNYFTGRRGDPALSYNESTEFPEIRQHDTVYYFSPGGFFRDSVPALGSTYHPILINNRTRIYSIITNVDALTGDNRLERYFTYRMADTTDGSYKHLDSLLYVKFDVSDPINWKSQESVHGIDLPVLVNGDVTVYPNPCFLPAAGGINFVLPVTPVSTVTTAHLLVLTSAFRRVYDNDVTLTADLSGRSALIWDATNTLSGHPSSGVYFFVITMENETYQGKFIILRN